MVQNDNIKNVKQITLFESNIQIQDGMPYYQPQEPMVLMDAPTMNQSMVTTTSVEYLPLVKHAQVIVEHELLTSQSMPIKNQN